MGNQLESLSKLPSLLLFILCILFIITTLQPNHVSAQPPTEPTYFIEFCQSSIGNYTTNSTYERNLKKVLFQLQNVASSSPSANTTAGTNKDRVHGQYYCRGDIGSHLCSECISQATQSILKNCSTNAAIMWYQECTLQYGNHSIVGTEAEFPRSWASSRSNVSDTVHFGAVLNSTVEKIITESAYGDPSLHFATGEGVVSRNVTAYCLVQCRPDLNGTQCETCLRSAYGFVSNCCGKWADFVFVFFPSCQLRYSTESAFYTMNETAVAPSLSLPVQPPPPPPVKGGSTTVNNAERKKLGLVVVAAVAFLIFGATT